MSTLNQCTYAITSNTPLLQYYRICYTCSKDHQLVRVCLNCTSLCHENHKIGPVLREKFYCQCHIYGNCCRALSNFHIEDDVHGSGSKKRKRTSNAASTNPAEDSERFVVWSKQNQENKKLIVSYHTLEEANEHAKQFFIQENPWGWTEREMMQNEDYNIATNKVGNVFHFIQDADQETWQVGTSSIDSFLEDVNRHYKPQFQKLSDLKPSTGSNSLLKTPKSNMAMNLASSVGFHLRDDNEDDDEMVIFATNPRAHHDEDPTPSKEDKKPRKRARKEAGAPKGPVHSFMIFSNMNRDRIQGENPGMSMVDLSKLIGAKWKEMTAEEKQPFEELAVADRMRYSKEMEEYRRKKADGTLEIPPPKIPGKRGPRKKKVDVEQPVTTASASKKVNKDKADGGEDGDESISDVSTDEAKDSVEGAEKDEEELLDEEDAGMEEDGDEDEEEAEEEESTMIKEEIEDENSETINFAR